MQHLGCKIFEGSVLECETAIDKWLNSIAGTEIVEMSTLLTPYNAARNIARKGTESLRKLKRSGSVNVLGVK